MNQILQTSIQTVSQMILKFKSGGEIYINPKNKGKFTSTKKRTGKSTAELKYFKNPLTRKRAVFAQNAKKWAKKHESGGLLDFIQPLIDNFKSGGKLK